MIVMIRLDERLIHGQVAIKWSQHTGVDRIVVADDEAAANPLIQKSLMMAAPPTAKTAIKDVDAAIELLKNPKAADHKILVIVSNPPALLKVVTQVADIPLVNVGNYGRVAPKADGEQRKTYRKNLYAYDNEIMDLKKVVETGIKCNYQTVPDDTPEELSKVIS